MVTEKQRKCLDRKKENILRNIPLLDDTPYFGPQGHYLKLDMLFGEEHYEPKRFVSYAPVCGDIVLRNSGGAGLLANTRLSTINLISAVENGIEITKGPNFGLLLHDFQRFTEGLAGIARISKGIVFLRRNFSYDNEFSGESTFLTTEEIIKNRKGVCLDFSIILSMLINSVDSASNPNDDLERVEMVGGCVYSTRHGDPHIQSRREIPCHSWLRTSSGLIADPTYDTCGIPNNDTSSIPKTVEIASDDDARYVIRLNLALFPLASMECFSSYYLQRASGELAVYFEDKIGFSSCDVLVRTPKQLCFLNH